MIDGCGDLRFFFQIVLPLSSPLIAVMTLFYAVGKWNSFFDGLIYLRTPTKYPLQLVLRDILITGQLMLGGSMQDVGSITERLRLSELLKYSIMIVSSLPILIFYPFVQKYFTKGIMLGAIKG
jgi:putative aldouronate transport system permease protein